MADPRIPANELGAIRDLIREIQRRLDELEKPTGTQLSKAVEKILELFHTLEQTVAAHISALSYTRAQIEGLSWLNVLPPGKGGTGTKNAAENIFTSGGPWYVTYVKANGEMGHVPSLTRLKQDIREAFPAGGDSPEVFLTVPVRMYRFKDDVRERGDEAYTHHGFLAEEIAELGLEPLLQRDSDGELFGVAYERVWVYHHEILRRQQAHIIELEQRLNLLEGE